ncbi:flagellar basal body-associated FliL family protein [Frigidibacter oleivorans]|uniref:flagellar basal body-associated FliL family protein n=1 Tax=Frigidibacter oleivorans TaxID=2487129 RepID=UPI000F8F8000|nr:flagellar basal body-associated FliL family protein [Frigidibacter oleivorans]
MSQPETPADPPRRSKLPLLLGLVLAILGGAGGFFAVRAQLIPGLGAGAAAPEEAHPALPGHAEVAFVPVPQIIVTLGSGGTARHLRFSAQIEVTTAGAEETAHLMPRILDVLNSYLRAVETRDLEEPSNLMQLRAQMLRRVQAVTGEGLARDLLITEFVLN